MKKFFLIFFKWSKKFRTTIWRRYLWF